MKESKPSTEAGATPSLPTGSQNEPQEEHHEHSAGEQDEDQLQTDLNHELHIAIENDDLNMVTKVLDEGADLEARFFYRFNPDFDVSRGLTPLLLAAGLGLGDIFQLLLDRGADISARTTDLEEPAFYIAARCGRMSTMEIVLEKSGADTIEDSNNQGRRPLGAAAINGHLDVVNFLISRGADVTAKDGDGFSSLHLATYEGELSIAQRLLAENPELLEDRDCNGDTSFAIAASLGFLPLVEFFMTQKADIYAKGRYGGTGWHLSAKEGHIDVIKKLFHHDPGFRDTQNDLQETALILAAGDGHVSVVEQLLSWGSDIDARRYNDNGAIHGAARYGHVKMAELLLRQRRDLLHSRGFNGRTPFSMAAEEGQLAMCEFLAEEGADITTMDQDENQPIHLAAAFGHLPIVESLLRMNQDLLNARGNLGQTALFQALMYSTSTVGDYLLFQKNADTSIVDRNSATILHAAAHRGHIKASKYILQTHPEIIDYKDIKGHTALAIASTFGYSDFVIDLLNEGADATLKNQSGRTPLHIACCNGYLEITRLLSGPQAKYRSRNSQIAYIGANDNDGDTALIDAITESHTSIALHLLETDIFFPQSPSNVDPYVSRDKEKTKVEDFLMNLLQEESGEAKPKIEAATYWAISNGRKSLLSKFVSDHGLDLKSWSRGGLSCTHVASFGDNVDLMKYLLLDQGCPLTCDPNGISPFHIAVKYNQVDLVQKMILWLDKPATDDGSVSSIEPEDLALREIHGTRNGARCAILKKQKDGHTSISLAASGRYENHRRLEALLWDTLDRSIEQNKIFAPGQELDEEAHLILELAAQFDDPGTEIHLRAYLNRMMQAEAAPVEDTTLRLAVHCQLPVVVWWLLSNGGYRSGNHIEDAQCLVAEWDKRDEHGRYTQVHIRKDIKEIMNEVLENPPPLLKQEAWRYEEKLPEFQHKKEKFSSLKGTVIDFFHEGHTASFQLKRRPISAIIYEEGPQKIMEPGKYGDLKSIKDKITQKPDGPPLKWRKDKHQKTFDHTSGDDTSGALVKKPKASRTNGPTSNVELEESNTKRKTNDPTWAAPMLSEKTTEARKPPDLRWIHIPENNLDCVQDLMVRMSLEKDVKNRDHRPWTQFVQRSWVQLPAGGNTSYMKPQYLIYQDKSDKSEKPGAFSESGRSSALYMPYLFWEKRLADTPGECESDSTMPKVEHSSSGSTAPMKPCLGEIELCDDYVVQLDGSPPADQKKQSIIHGPMTLDQYYYVSLQDTRERDRDQVLWRATDPTCGKAPRAQMERLQPPTGKPNTSPEKNRSGVTKQENPPIGPEERKILTVNQLWLWKLDQNTIITCSTKELDEGEASFLQRVLVSLKVRGETSAVTSVTADSLKELILSTAIGLFYRREINVLGKHLSALDVYRQAILAVRNSEASLFKAFTKSLKEGDTGSEVNPNDTTEATQQGQVDQHGNDQNAHSDEGSQNKTPDRRSTDNLYADISEETKLLREVKDICDELNMLKNLAEDQDDVWTQVWKGGNRPDATTYDTPTEVKAEIEEMVNEAEFVQKAIETLLDLKQKRANIVEAEFTRQQSHDTAVQSDTIMVFTVVTILFLPASFLTSLLALNISDFPHAGGDVKFEGRLIFPVIFGVSVAVSGLFSIIAFNASKLKEFLGWKKHHTNVASITSQPNSRSGSSSSLPVNESQVNKSSISVKEMSSSRENLQDHSYPEQPGVPWYKGRRRKLQEGVGV